MEELKAVIYARYSSSNQREESIEGQIRECTEYAHRKGITILRSYIDRAQSALTSKRPAFQEMIADSKTHIFNVVLVYRFDRFSRDVYDSAVYKHALRENGVKVVSAMEEIPNGPEGILVEGLFTSFASYYSAELSQKIIRGNKENALKGKQNGGRPPLGYLLDPKTQKLIIDPVKAPIVQEVFQRYADGEAMQSIVNDLNARGLRTNRGNKFVKNTLQLSNRKYIGEYRCQDVFIADGIPAIINTDTFNKVQERIKKNRRAPAAAKAQVEYLLSTKLFCGECGSMLVGECGTSKTGTIHHYYKCGKAKRTKECHQRAIRKNWIEQAVINLTMNQVLTPHNINRIIERILIAQKQEDTTTTLRKQLSSTDTKISNLLAAIEQGIITPSTKQRLNELEEEKEQLQHSIQVAELAKATLSKEQLQEWFKQFKANDPTNIKFQKRVIDIFVNSIYVYKDKLVITYNYKDGTETVTFEDINKALGSNIESDSAPC
jgi:site-specific DNA recombinase